MRNGKIQAENSPAKIVSHLEVENLQEALYKLCERNDRDLSVSLDSELTRDKASVDESSIPILSKPVSKMLKLRTMLARNILMIYRSKV